LLDKKVRIKSKEEEMIKTKNLKWVGVLVGAFLILTVGIALQANALPLPVLDFQGGVTTTVDDATNAIIDRTAGAGVTQYWDKDGNLHDVWPWTPAPNDDPILGQAVLGYMPSGISYDWANDVLSVDPNASAVFQIGLNSDVYLRALATSITVIKVGTRDYRINAKLENQTLNHLNDSTFMSQYSDAIGTNGVGQLLTWDLVFEIEDFVDLDNDGIDDATKYAVNISGKVAPAPVPEPATIMLMGAGLIGIGGMARKRIFKEA